MRLTDGCGDLDLGTGGDGLAQLSLDIDAHFLVNLGRVGGVGQSSELKVICGTTAGGEGCRGRGGQSNNGNDGREEFHGCNGEL